MKRRSFLQGLVAAPVAAPVIARDAAEKAGLAKLGGSQIGLGTPPTMGMPLAGGAWELDWVKKIFSSSFESELRENMFVQCLDPDLASLRSFSLAAAIRIQKERNVQKKLKERRIDAAQTYKRITGQEWPL